MTWVNELVQFGRNFDLKMRDHEKISYERRAYESVDDRSLPKAITRKFMENNSGQKGLILQSNLS